MKSYLSYLRILCNFSVIIVHVSTIHLWKINLIPITDWQIVNFTCSLFRFGIPVFFMISGAILLNRTEDLQTHLKKRAKRILIPFFVWTFFYFLYYNFQNLQQENIIRLIKEYGLFVYQGAQRTEMWFIYTIISFYLFIPILRKWVQYASKKEILYFLIIWGITLFQTKQTQFLFPSIDLKYFSSYFGCLILGFYLDKHVNHQKEIHKILYFFIFLIGVALTFALTSYYSISKNELIRNFYWNYTPNVILAASGLFLFIKSISNNKPINSWVNTANNTSYGIYLIHALIITTLGSYIKIYNQHSAILLCLEIIIYSISVYILSFLTIYFLTKVSFLNKIVT